MITLYANGKLKKAEDNRTIYSIINIITILSVIFAVIGFILSLIADYVPIHVISV
ncbi:MAG: hypothetical protein J6U23_09685 [Clostridiales bacterium]|nr:hypothetical protein [Clostridiales bacterium]